MRAGLPLMWRDRWWRMYDKDPIMNWVAGRVVLTGDAAHSAAAVPGPIEDAWVLSEHVGRQQAAGELDWDARWLPTTRSGPNTAVGC